MRLYSVRVEKEPDFDDCERGQIAAIRVTITIRKNTNQRVLTCIKPTFVVADRERMVIDVHLDVLWSTVTCVVVGMAPGHRMTHNSPDQYDQNRCAISATTTSAQTVSGTA